MQEIVVVGGGTGGTLMANLLARRFKASQARVTLISNRSRHLGWLYVPFGWMDQRSLSRPLKSLLSRRVNLTIGEVERVEPDTNRLFLKTGDVVAYDFLVLSTGSEVFPQEVPGLAEGGDHYYTEAGSLQLYSKLQDFSGGRIVVGVGGLPHKCPVAPLEFTFLLDEFLTRRGLRDKTEIVYTYPINRVFSIESVANLAAPILEQRGVVTETFFNLEEVDPSRRRATSMEGTELDYDLLIMIPPHRGAGFLQQSSLADTQGWVKTDRTSLRVAGCDNVWAIGDTTDLPISKAGSTAHFQAPAVVEQLAEAVTGQAADPRRASYHGHVMCFLETGHNQATLLDFDYDRPPTPAPPNAIVHYQKMVFNRAYWYLVPTGVL